MTIIRDTQGKWLRGHSGNPDGRPVGARDKKQRFCFDGRRNWPCERNLGDYAKAEPLHKRSLAITEKALGPDHPDVATSLNNLAGLYDTQGHYARAEPLYKRSLAIFEKALGADHPHVATSLENLAVLYRATKRNEEAGKLERRATKIRAMKR